MWQRIFFKYEVFSLGWIGVKRHMKKVHKKLLVLKIRNSKLNQEVQILWQRIFSISKKFGSKRNFATTVFQERMSWTGMLNQFTKGNPLKGKALDFENLIWENSDRSLNEKFVYLLEIKFWFLLWWIRLNLLLIWFIRGSDWSMATFKQKWGSEQIRIMKK